MVTLIELNTREAAQDRTEGVAKQLLDQVTIRNVEPSPEDRLAVKTTTCEVLTRARLLVGRNSSANSEGNISKPRGVNGERNQEDVITVTVNGNEMHEMVGEGAATALLRRGRPRRSVAGNGQRRCTSRGDVYLTIGEAAITREDEVLLREALRQLESQEMEEMFPVAKINEDIVAMDA